MTADHLGEKHEQQCFIKFKNSREGVAREFLDLIAKT